MARILILEIDPDVRALLARVVLRLGHEPLALTARPPGRPPRIDALLVEPAWEEGLELAAELKRENPRLPVAIASIDPESPARGQLRPLAYLVKPYGLAEVERAIASLGAGSRADEHRGLRAEPGVPPRSSSDESIGDEGE